MNYGRVLDVYAGSGALGIEALSRGDGRCDFVERSAKAADVIRENLALTNLQGRGKVYVMKAEQAEERLEGPYALIIADPPYEDPHALAIIDGIARSTLADAATTLVLECSSRSVAPEQIGALRMGWNRRYGDTQIALYEEAP